ncbi:dihydrofolate reductase family protein [Actinokineospora guangxiensis]|uniref:Dihydrofolate reductase family protein n=1 Tax=Actinokineospora guangxiensis TaxID=1490288 RepID=A0ABW0EQU5_9PSEU
MRKLVYYVGMSIDGFISGPDGEVDFLPVTDDVVGFIVQEYPDALPTHVRAQLGVDSPNRRFDVCIQGRATYQPALDVGITSPYAHLRQIVASRSLGAGLDPAVEVVAGDVVALVRELKAQEGRDIYLAGGGQLAGELLGEVDALVLKVYPVVAGDGVPLFRAGFSPVAFSLVDSRALPSGMVVLSYERT